MSAVVKKIPYREGFLLLSLTVFGCHRCLLQRSSEIVCGLYPSSGPQCIRFIGFFPAKLLVFTSKMAVSRCFTVDRP